MLRVCVEEGGERERERERRRVREREGRADTFGCF